METEHMRAHCAELDGERAGVRYALRTLREEMSRQHDDRALEALQEVMDALQVRIASLSVDIDEARASLAEQRGGQ